MATLTSFVCRVLIVIIVDAIPTFFCKDFEVIIKAGHEIHRVDDKFVSISLDTSIIKYHWEKFNTSSTRVQALAKGLFPSHLRVGGTSADSLRFNVTAGHDRTESPSECGSDLGCCNNSPIHNSTLSGSDWDKLNKFATESGWNLIFGLNSLLRRAGKWDPTNALLLMKYTAQKGYKVDFELGNEPDIYDEKYNVTVDPGQLGRDFGVLRALMNSMPPFSSSLLVGPDVTQANRTTTRLFLEKFMRTGSEFISAMSFHHYYLNGHFAKPSDFLNPAKLDSLVVQLVAAKQIIANFSHGTKKIWLGETSSAYGGGAPGVSDTFLAGFMWLDKLGLCAKYGIDTVVRQDFVGGSYGLVDFVNNTYSPNPDYWLTLLYKKLVGESVLLTKGLEQNLRFRVYSHCANKRSGYKPGSIAVYMMNLFNSSVNVTFPEYTGHEIHLYLLTSGEAHTLTSRLVKLNGEVLQMLDKDQLPPLPPKILKSVPFSMQPLSLGFVVIPDAEAPACQI